MPRLAKALAKDAETMQAHAAHLYSAATNVRSDEKKRKVPDDSAYVFECATCVTDCKEVLKDEIMGLGGGRLGSGNCGRASPQRWIFLLVRE